MADKKDKDKGAGEKPDLKSVPTGEEAASDAATVDGEDTGQHAEIREKVKVLRAQAEETYWELSAALNEVYQGSLYQAWGFDKWADYVEKELDFTTRKSQYLIGIQEWFGKMPPNVQKWVRELGWSKAKELVGVVTAENAAEWKKKIEGKSVREIIEMIKGAKRDGEDGGGDGGGEGAEETSKKMSFTLFPAQFENVERALEKAKKMAESEKPGHALDMICTDFLTNNGGTDTVKEYLAKVEKHTGVRIVGYDTKNDVVVYGSELLDELAEPVEEGEGDGEPASDTEATDPQ